MYQEQHRVLRPESPAPLPPAPPTTPTPVTPKSYPFLNHALSPMSGRTSIPLTQLTASSPHHPRQKSKPFIFIITSRQLLRFITFLIREFNVPTRLPPPSIRPTNPQSTHLILQSSRNVRQ